MGSSERKKVTRMTAVVKKQGKSESREQMKALHENFSKKVTASGLTHMQIEEAVRKARTDVRKARRSSSN